MCLHLQAFDLTGLDSTTRSGVADFTLWLSIPLAMLSDSALGRLSGGATLLALV